MKRSFFEHAIWMGWLGGNTKKEIIAIVNCLEGLLRFTTAEGFEFLGKKVSGTKKLLAVLIKEMIGLESAKGLQFTLRGEAWQKSLWNWIEIAWNIYVAK